MIAEALGERGAAVTVAASGREALELLERSAFDALVCDISMPEMDGYELLKRLRAMETARGRRLPAIALTALAHREDRLHALRAGFQAHVAKPVTLAELVVVLDSIVRLHPQERS
jgi:CheY-like chemotaxis protein